MGHLLQDCGIDFERVRKYERGPCLHCFRHTFVAKAFDQLLQTPLDFADAVPFISTYAYGCDLIREDNAVLSPYGLLHRADYQPMLSPMQETQKMEMKMK